MTDAVELSEARFAELVGAIYGTPPDDGQRRETRLRTSEHVKVLPFNDTGPGHSVIAEVWDLSRGGIAVLMPHELRQGQRFDVKVPRAGKRDLEVLCEVRHCRPHRDGRFVVGASFGASWLSTMAAMMQPPPLASEKSDETRRSDHPMARRVRSREVE